MLEHRPQRWCLMEGSLYVRLDAALMSPKLFSIPHENSVKMFFEGILAWWSSRIYFFITTRTVSLNKGSFYLLSSHFNLLLSGIQIMCYEYIMLKKCHQLVNSIALCSVICLMYCSSKCFIFCRIFELFEDWNKFTSKDSYFARLSGQPILLDHFLALSF